MRRRPYVYAARHVLAGVAPHVLSGLLGDPPPDGQPPEGAQLKINMLLERLPRVPGASSEDAFTGTFHVNEGYEQLAAPTAGRAPARSRPSRRARSTATR